MLSPHGLISDQAFNKLTDELLTKVMDLFDTQPIVRYSLNIPELPETASPFPDNQNQNKTMPTKFDTAVLKARIKAINRQIEHLQEAVGELEGVLTQIDTLETFNAAAATAAAKMQQRIASGQFSG